VRARREPLTLRSPSLTLLAEVGVLKQHGVAAGESELGADFISFFSCQEL
jgi:hypothetical protein